MKKKSGMGDGALLDHIAIAVEDLTIAKNIYQDMGAEFAPETEVVASEGVETLFAPLDQQAHLELLAPYGSDGPIHKYLQKNGPGIHHLCFRVKDIEKKCHELRQKGYQLIYENPRRGAKGVTMNFVHPKSSRGVLIELVQVND